MKKRVYDFICTHPDTNIHDIAPVVNEPELEVLKTVNALYRDGYESAKGKSKRDHRFSYAPSAA